MESVSEEELLKEGVGYARSGTQVDPFDPIALDLEEQNVKSNVFNESHSIDD